MRMVFLDEAGISKPEQEPYLVVGGIIVHADQQWQALQRELVKLANQYAPKGAPQGFSFHAKDLWHGSGDFPRASYDRETRWKILHELVALPAKFGLPVVATYIQRAGRDFVRDYVECFIGAMCSVEAYMRALPDRNEVASVILEDNHRVRQHVKEMQASMRDEKSMRSLPAHERDKRWLTRIVGEPHFESKGPSSLLQISDVIAFFAKREVSGKKDAVDFCDAFNLQIVHPLQAKTAAEYDREWEAKPWWQRH